MADILVIVVSFNATVWLERCLGSIAASFHQADALIIDNCSTDGTPDTIQEKWPQFKLIRSKENLGFGAANNIGLRYALEKGYRYVYLLNQDAYLERDTLEVLIGMMASQSGAGFGIISPLQRDAAGNLDRNFDKKCGKYLKRHIGSAMIEVPFVMAAHWLMSADCIRLVGGFSPAFKQYGEDDNYIDRLHYNGLKCAVVPSTSAIHDRGERKVTRADAMKFKTRSSIVRVSNPARCFYCAFICEIFMLLGMALKNFSIVPVKFIGTLFRRRSELKHCSIASRGKGAWL